MRKVMENSQIDQETLQGVMHQDDFTDEAQGPLEEMPDGIIHANDKTRNVVANDDYLEGEYPE